MVIKIRKRLTYISFIFFICSFLLVSPILSPSINGKTIYLNWFIPFLDIYFVRFLTNKLSIMKTKFQALIGAFILTSILLLHLNYMLLFKILSIVFSVIYLQYAYDKIGFGVLYKAFNINIFIAILQFILYYTNYGLSIMIGPANIARTLWGKYATATFTNFYPIFYLTRTCGLSREAGFFAALLCIIVLIYIVDSKIEKTKGQRLLFLLAYIVSISKMSIALPIMLVIYKYRKQINKIPLFILTLLFIVIMGIFVNYLIYSGIFLTLGQSLIHRFWGYGMIFGHLSIKEFFLGNATGAEGLEISATNSFMFVEELGTFITFCGLPSIVIFTGYSGLLGLVMLLTSMKIKSSSFMILLIATIDVDLFTATSFVVLAYWLAIFAYRLDSKCLCQHG